MSRSSGDKQTGKATTMKMLVTVSKRGPIRSIFGQVEDRDSSSKDKICVSCFPSLVALCCPILLLVTSETRSRPSDADHQDPRGPSGVGREGEGI